VSSAARVADGQFRRAASLPSRTLPDSPGIHIDSPLEAAQRYAGGCDEKWLLNEPPDWLLPASSRPQQTQIPSHPAARQPHYTPRRLLT